MIRITLLFYVLFTVINVNCSTDNTQQLLPAGQANQFNVQNKLHHSLLNANNTPNQNDKALEIHLKPNNLNSLAATCGACFDDLKIGIQFGLTIVNLVLPALLTVDKGLFMEILHFALRGSTHIIIALPMMIANSVLLFLKQNQLIVNKVMGEADVSFLNPSSVTTGVMIALPAFMEIRRGCRGLSFKESVEERVNPDPSNLKEALNNYMVFVLDLLNTIMPTFLQPALFFPLFVLSQLVQLEVETVYLLFAANIASICHPASNYPYVDMTKIYAMIVFGSLRGLFFAGPCRKHFAFLLLGIFVVYLLSLCCIGDILHYLTHKPQPTFKGRLSLF